MKKVLVLSLSLVLVLGMSRYVFSENYTAMLSSGPGITNAVGHDPTYYLSYPTNKYIHICGGDVGIWFYVSSVGLQSSFQQSSSREVYIDQYEKDSNSHTCSRKYVGYFGQMNGLNCPVSYGNTYTNPSTIENDGGVEMNCSFKVTAIAGDTSTAVPAGLIPYRHWIVD